MAKERFIPEVLDENADRAVSPLSKFQAEVARNPLVNGVMVDVDATEDGPIFVSHGLGRRAVGAIVVASDRGVFTASVVDSQDGESTLAMSSEWEIVERVDIEADKTSFDFDAGLSDADYEVMVDGYWLHGSESTAEILWRVNAGSSASLSNCHSSFTFRGASGGTTAGLLIARSATSSNTEHRFNNNFLLVKDQNRICYGFDNMTWGTAASQNNNRHIAGKWEDAATEITSLGIVCTIAGEILVGSHFTLLRKPRLSGRKLKIWIF